MMPIYANRNISILYRHSQRYLSARLKPHGIAVGQFLVLLRVMNAPNITQDGLSAALAMDKGTIARSVADLERKGFILRIPDEIDRRVNHVQPTEKTLLLRQDLIGIVDDLHGILYEGLSTDEIDQLVKLIDRMQINLLNSF